MPTDRTSRTRMKKRFLPRHSRRKSQARPRHGRFESLEPRLLLAADWQNPSQRLDVNNDFAISPLDALVGINRLNERGPGTLGQRDIDSNEFYFDASGDGSHSPLDVLHIFNALNDNAPVVAARLANDTAPGGTTNRDRVTSDPSIRINLAYGGPATVKAGFGDAELSTIIQFSPDAASSITLGRTELAEIFGDALEDGDFTLNVQATFGNRASEVLRYEFTLDTQRPTITQPVPPLYQTAPNVLVFGFGDHISSVKDPSRYHLHASLANGAVASFTPDSVVSNSERTLVGLTFSSKLPDGQYTLTVPGDLADVAGNQLDGSKLMTFSIVDPTKISSMSPANGESLVSVARSIIIRFNDTIDPATLTTDTIKVFAANSPIDGTLRVSTTEGFVTFFPDAPLPPSTEIRVVMDGEYITGRDGLLLDADGDGIPGGVGNVSFRTLPLTRIEGTNVFGFVRDSITQEPLEGVTIRVDAFPEANAITDENGRFELVDMPSPVFFVHIDGSTATNAAAGTVYPNVGKPFHSEPGQTIQLNHHGHTFDVFLPPVSVGDIQQLSASESTDVGFGATGRAQLEQMFPNFAPAMFDTMAVTIEPGSALDNAGNVLTQAVVIPVPPDRLPAPLPENSNPELVVSIQIPGATGLDVPASISFPNLAGLEPGAGSLIYQFDHAAGHWHAIGSATVSEDGMRLVSNGGVVTAPGWWFVDPATDGGVRVPFGGSGSGAPGGGGPGGGGPGGGDPDNECSLLDQLLGRCGGCNFLADLNNTCGEGGNGVAIEGTSKLFTKAGEQTEIVLHNVGIGNETLRVKIVSEGIQSFARGIPVSATVTLQPGQKKTFRLVNKVLPAPFGDVDGELFSGTVRIFDYPNANDRSQEREAAKFTFARLVLPDGEQLALPSSVFGLDELETESELRLRERGPQTSRPQVKPDDAGALSVEQSGDGIITIRGARSDEEIDQSLKIETRVANASQAPQQMGAVAVKGEIVDLDPLQIRIVSGTIVTRANGFTGSGTIEIGLKAQGAFEPLVTLDGSLEVDDRSIVSTGTISTSIGTFDNSPLFEGRFSIARGSAESSSLDDNGLEVAGEIKYLGMDLLLKGVQFRPDGLRLTAAVTLPQELGGIVVELPPVILRPTGLFLETISFAFPDQQFPLFGLDVQATNLSITLVQGAAQSLKIQGKLTLQSPVQVVADLSGQNFIQIVEDPKAPLGVRVDIVGELFIERIPLVGPWALTDVKLSYDSPKREIRGVSGLTIPTGLTVLAGIGIIDNDFNFIRVGVDNLNLALGQTGAFLQKVVGEVDNVSLKDKDPVTFSGEVGVTLGPKLGARLPDFLGGDRLEAELVSVIGTGSISAEGISIGGTIELISGEVGGQNEAIATGSGNLGFTYKDGGFKADATLDILRGTYVFKGRLAANKNFDISGSGTATVKIPAELPVLGGVILAEATTQIRFRNNGTLADDYVSSSREIAGNRIGVRVYLDGRVQLSGGFRIGPISGGTGGEGEGTNGMTFPIAGDHEVVFLQARWENESDTTQLSITQPDGTIIEERDLANRLDIELIPELTSSTMRTIGIRTASRGSWHVNVVNSSGLGTVTFEALGASKPSEIVLTTPLQDVSNSTAIVSFDATEAEDNATVTLHADTDREERDGRPVHSFRVGDVVDANRLAQVAVDLSDLAADDYYLYATVDDDNGITTFSNYTTGRVQVVAAGAPDAVMDLAANWVGGDRVAIHWTPVAGADFYTVSITDDAAGEVLQQSVSTDGDVSNIVLSANTLEHPLIPGETYRVEVRAASIGNGLSPSSMTVAVVGPSATVPPAVGQHEVFADPGTLFTSVFARSPGDSLSLVSAPTGATLDESSGQFEWDVPITARGFFETVVHRVTAEGSTDVWRGLHYVDANRTGELSGQKFSDINRDGLRNSGEAGMNDVDIELVDVLTGDVLATATTHSIDLDGNASIDPETEMGVFRFLALTPGSYIVREVIDASRSDEFPEHAQSFPVDVIGGETIEVSFGNVPVTGAISGVVFNDINGDGGLNPGDVRLGDVTVYLDSNDNGRLDDHELTVTTSIDNPSTTIDETGEYTFSRLPAGSYRIGVVVPSQLRLTGPSHSTTHEVELSLGGRIGDQNFTLRERHSFIEGSLVRVARGDDHRLLNRFLDLGTTQVAAGQLATPLVLFNSGDDPTTIESVRLVGSDAFSAPSTVVGSVLPGGRTVRDGLAFDVMFDPPSFGVHEATLEIHFDDQSQPLRLSFRMLVEDSRQKLSFEVFNNNVGGSVIGGTLATDGFGVLQNRGQEDLTITRAIIVPLDTDPQSANLDNVAGTTSYELTLGDTSTALPIVLTPGTTLDLNLTFRPTRLGLQPAKILLFSDDPDQPVLARTVVGTGVATGGPRANVGNDFVSITLSESPNATVFRVVSNDRGVWNFSLPPNRAIEVATFDPNTALIAHTAAVSNRAGGFTSFSDALFSASVAHDSDGDGLPDDIETALGTSIDSVDTDRDGLSDFRELELGLSPLNDRGLPNGIIASLNIPGGANDVVVVASPNDPQRLTAYVASGAGLTVVDVSSPQLPSVIANVASIGAVDVGVDETLGLAAIVGGSGLAIIDIDDPANSNVVATLSEASGTVVEVFGGIAYVGNSQGIKAIDLESRTVVGTLNLSNIDDLAIADGALYAVARGLGHTVLRLPLDPSFSTPPVTLNITHGQHPIFGRLHIDAGDGLIYVGGPDESFSRQVPGVEILRDDDNAIVLVGNPSGVTAFEVAATGSSTILYGGANSRGPNRADVALLDAADLTVTDQVLATFATPGSVAGIEVAAGLAYVADGSGGLHVLNYQSVDTQSQAPSIAVDLSNADQDENRPGIQVGEGSRLAIDVDVSDDVQVRHVQLFINDVLTAIDTTFPFEFSPRAPFLTAGISELSLRIEAVDTGGNREAAVDELVELVRSPLMVSSVSPRLGTIFQENAVTIRISFSRGLETSTLSSDSFTLQDESGRIFEARQVDFNTTGDQIELSYTDLPGGTYALAIDSANIKDLSGETLVDPGTLTSFEILRPTVTAVSPASGTAFLQNDIAVTISFSKRLDTSTLSSDSFTLQDESGRIFEVRQVDFNTTGDQVELSYSALPSGKYALTLDSATIKGILGDSIVEPGVLTSFEILRPVVGEVSLASGSVLPAAPFTITLSVSQPLDPTTVVAPAFHLRDGIGNTSNPATVALSPDGLEITLSLGSLPPEIYTLHLVDDVVTSTTGSSIAGRLLTEFQIFNQPPQIFPDEYAFLGRNVRDFVAADFNGDGNLDLVAADLGSATNGKLVLAFGQGDGSFIAGNQPLLEGQAFVSIETADLDRDGNADIVAGSGENQMVLAILGNGDGTFRAAVDFASGVIPRDLTIGDLNNDGVADLVAKDTFGHEITRLLGNGDGTFGIAATIATSNVEGPLHLIDVDNDGNLDFFLSEARLIHYFFGDGSGGIAQDILSQNSNSAFSLAADAGDVSGDGLTDIVLSAGHGIRLLLGVSDQRIPAIDQFIPSPEIVGEVRLVDVDRDGDLDVYASGRVAMNEGSGVFAALQDAGGAGGLTGKQFRDVNNDGILDVLQPVGRGVLVLPGLRDNSFVDITAGITLDHNLTNVVSGDFDEDGQMDLIIAAHETIIDPDTSQQTVLPGLKLLRGNGDGSFGTPVTFDDAPTFIGFLETADLNGDQHLDLVTTSGSDSKFFVQLGAGNGTFSAPVEFVLDANSLEVAALLIADVNNDQRPDVLTVQQGGFGEPTDEFGPPVTLESVLVVSINDGQGSFAAGISVPVGFGATALSVDDVDDDGQVDIVVGNEGSFDDLEFGEGGLRGNGLTVLLGDGTGSFTARIDAFHFATVSDIVLADVNGDGLPDAVVADGFDAATLNDAESLSVLLGQGDGTFAVAIALDIGTRASRIRVADIDNDGRLDIFSNIDSFGIGAIGYPGLFMRAGGGGDRGGWRAMLGEPAAGRV